MSNNNTNDAPGSSASADNDQPEPGQVAPSASRGRRSINNLERRRSLSSIEGLGPRNQASAERRSSYHLGQGSPYDIFEPRNALPNSQKPMRNGPLQTHSSTELHEVELPHNVVNREEIPLHTMPSVASYCCRFCQLGDEREVLISPCKCKGSLAYIHYSCLTRWLNQSGRNTCELCQFKFNTVETRRYTMCQSLRLWVRHPRNRPHIQTIVFISLLLTLFVFGLVLMVMMGMHHFITEGRKIGVAPYWISGTFGFFIILLLVVYVLTMYLLFRDQCGPWYRWWHRCVSVRIVIDPNTVKAPSRPYIGTIMYGKAQNNSTSSSDSLETTTNALGTNIPR